MRCELLIILMEPDLCFELENNWSVTWEIAGLIKFNKGLGGRIYAIRIASTLKLTHWDLRNLRFDLPLSFYCGDCFKDVQINTYLKPRNQIFF